MNKSDTKFTPVNLNLELTTNCPLRCPQCYCSLTGGKNLDLQTAVHWLKEAGSMGVKEVMLSGGETMCYPNIYEVIKAAREYCGNANVALSGYKLNQDTYEKLIDAGVTRIFISLNGSTEEINSLTRDGFGLAVDALELLSENNYPNTTINWVMHSSNSDDFVNVVKIAEKYHVDEITVIGLKTLPSADQMKNLKTFIRSYTGSVKIGIESCFSPMLALACDTKLFGNFNTGKFKGCGAGRYNLSVNVEGLLSPCRHLDYYEKFDTLEEYWNNSEILRKIRNAENEKREPCSSCRFSDYCRHCLAVNAKLNNDIYIGHPCCELHRVN